MKILERIEDRVSKIKKNIQKVHMQFVEVMQILRFLM